jgi:hypothetical protein
MSPLVRLHKSKTRPSIMLICSSGLGGRHKIKYKKQVEQTETVVIMSSSTIWLFFPLFSEKYLSLSGFGR